MAHGVLTLKEIYTAISDTDSIKFGARNAGIILFMLSSNLDQEFMAKLTINNLISACSDYLEDTNLDSLLTLDPWGIAPCWKGIQGNTRMVFSSPESTFYIFLHIKQRLKDKGIDPKEPLFMGEKNEGLKPNTIRDVITAVSNDSFSFSFTPSSLKQTYLNVCERYFSDNNLLELFTTEINEDNPYYSQSSDEIRPYYQNLIPLLTSRLFDASIENDGIDEDNVEKIIKDYYKKFYETHKDKYGEFEFYKILFFAKREAKVAFENGTFSDDITYLNNLFQQCQIYYLFIDSKYYQLRNDESFNYIPSINLRDFDDCLNKIIEIFDELKILDVFKPSRETLRKELIYYATHNNTNFYPIKYQELYDILINVLIPMCEGVYKTNF